MAYREAIWKALDHKSLALDRKIPFVLTMCSKLDTTQKTETIFNIVKYILDNELDYDTSTRLLIGLKTHFSHC